MSRRQRVGKQAPGQVAVAPESVGSAPGSPPWFPAPGPIWALVTGLGGLALVVVLVLAALGGVAEAPVLGDAGPAVRWAVPVLRALVDATGALGLGAFALVALIEPTQRPYPPALRLAGHAAALWALLQAALAVAVIARAGGVPPGDPRFWSVLVTVGATPLGIGSGVAVLGAAGAALLVRPGLRRTVGPAGARRWAFAAGGLAVTAALGAATGGHAAGSHAGQAVMVQRGVHVLGVSVWVGGLAALVVLAPRLWRDRLAVPAVRAYSMVAGWSFALVVVSGVVTASAVLGTLDPRVLLDADADGRRYLGLLAVKVLGLAALGLAGLWHRHRHLRGLDRHRMTALLRLASVELALVVVVLAAAAVLADTAPPTP